MYKEIRNSLKENELNDVEMEQKVKSIVLQVGDILEKEYKVSGVKDAINKSNIHLNKRNRYKDEYYSGFSIETYINISQELPFMFSTKPINLQTYIEIYGNINEYNNKRLNRNYRDDLNVYASAEYHLDGSKRRAISGTVLTADFDLDAQKITAYKITN